MIAKTRLTMLPVLLALGGVSGCQLLDTPIGPVPEPGPVGPIELPGGGGTWTPPPGVVVPGPPPDGASATIGDTLPGVVGQVAGGLTGNVLVGGLAAAVLAAVLARRKENQGTTTAGVSPAKVEP